MLAMAPMAFGADSTDPMAFGADSTAPIAFGAEGGDAYSRPGLPRAMYICGGNISFYAAARKNGLSRRDIKRKL